MSKSDRRYHDAIQVLTILEKAGYATRLAGGCVRDRLLGKAPYDFDVATAAHPEKTMEILRAANFKAIPTGLDHGTITAVLKHGPVEITTLREDKETDGRHAVVAYSDSFEADAARRDFTINAMFEDSTGQVTDFFSGRQHLSEKRLIFVGDPTARICEDYLRILRLFRFWAQLGFTPEPSTLAVITEQAPGLKRISQERKTSELWKLLKAPQPLSPIKAMIDTGVIKYLLSRFPVTVPNDEVAASLLKVSTPTRPLAWILWLTGATIDDAVEPIALLSLADELKLANTEKKGLVGWLVAWRELDGLGSSQANHMAWIDKTLEATATDRLDDFLQAFACAGPPARQSLLQAVAKTEETLGHLRRKALPLTGADVQRVLSVPPGPTVGLALEALKISFRNGDWRDAADGERWLLAHQGRV